MMSFIKKSKFEGHFVLCYHATSIFIREVYYTVFLKFNFNMNMLVFWQKSLENSVSYLKYSFRQKWLKHNTSTLTTEIQ